jgi:peptide/nickel transport system permease protein
VQAKALDKVKEKGSTSRIRSFRLDRNWRRVLVRGVLLLAIFMVAVFAPALAPHDPYAVSIRDRLEPPMYQSEAGTLFVLGTDAVGRDILSRMIAGSRLSLLIAASAVVIAVLTGSTVGLISGFVGGKVDNAIMRLGDIWLAFPEILLALSITAVLGPSVLNLIIALGFSRWISYARLVRGNVLSLREREFIWAARSIGASPLRLILQHVLPNVADVIIILAALHLGQMIVLEAALSFLGLGIQPPTPSWGGMIGDGRVYLHNAWWVATFPGLAIAITVLLAGLFGDALRDALDPRYRSI